MKKTCIFLLLLSCYSLLFGQSSDLSTVFGKTVSEIIENYGIPNSINVSKTSTIICKDDTFRYYNTNLLEQNNNDLEFIYNDFIIEFGKSNIVLPNPFFDNYKDYTVTAFTLKNNNHIFQYSDKIQIGDSTVTILTEMGAPTEYKEDCIMYKTTLIDAPFTRDNTSTEYAVTSKNHFVYFYLKNNTLEKILVYEYTIITKNPNYGR